jgi:DUF4097 and DUF4098 domain-containing protein YvlB
MEVHVTKVHDGRRGLSLVVTRLVALLLSGSLVDGCFTIGGTVQARDTVALTLAVPARTPVRVETFNGGIQVSARSGQDVSAEVERTGEGADTEEAEADRDAIEVTLKLVDGVALLQAVYAPSPDSIPGGSGATVTLAVPASTPLGLVTSNGPITVRDISGGIDARTSNGPVDLGGVAGALAVETSNGPVVAGTTDPVTLDIRTSNGGITFDGELQPGDATLETSNGPVELRLPSDAVFTIDATTSNSETTSEFEVSGAATASELQGTIGAPDQAAATRVTIRTSNSPITLTKAPEREDDAAS